MASLLDKIPSLLIKKYRILILDDFGANPNFAGEHSIFAA
jgi:DNA replication protein DnaC